MLRTMNFIIINLILRTDRPTDQPKYRGNFPWTSTLIVNYGFVKNKHVAIYKILLDSCFGRKNPQRSEVISYEGPKFRGFKKKSGMSDLPNTGTTEYRV